MKEENELAKWLAGEMTPEELAAFEKSAAFATYQKIARYSAELRAPELDSTVMYQNIISAKKQTTKTIPLTAWIFRVAAILAIGLGLFFGARNMVSFTESAETGQMASFSLPDDSRVTLNSGSEIRYKKWNWSHERALELRGEAFFKVAKGRKFEVGTSLGKVAVLGTQFSVKARGSRFEAECFEGKVWVRCGKQQAVLSKGEILVLEDGRILGANPSGTGKPAWMQHEIRFISLPLKEIILEIERNYAVRIELRGSDPERRFTGVIPKNNLKAALATIAQTYRLSLKTTAENKIILTPE